MHTYEELRSGHLAGATKLSLSEALESFPPEIFDLADSLEFLDLSGNRLEHLPDDFGRLRRLKVLFLSQNLFRQFPAVLSECPELTMIGFKSNRIEDIPEESFPRSLRWLILTDNRIEALPRSIGECTGLQKLMLAGNRISTLPDTMRQCRKLELVRLSANALEHLPDWLFDLPRLSWLACAGNPCTSASLPDTESLAEIAWEEISIHEVLGEGASGVISRGVIREHDHAAVKLFRSDITSDGYPGDEISASIAAGRHHNLNTPHGKISQLPGRKEALLFPLIPPIYCNLGNPPDLESCTRDTYDSEAEFPLPLLLRIVSDVASAALHLHQRAISHGDLYAHNILTDREGHSLLGDFGAATRYDRSVYGTRFEHLEVRAFGCLMEELLERCRTSDETGQRMFAALERIKDQCLNESVKARPLFEEIHHALSQLQAEGLS